MLRAFTDFDADAPLTKTVLANLTVAETRLMGLALNVSGPGDGSTVTLAFGVDATQHTDPLKTLILGWEVSEDAGKSWQLLAQHEGPGGVDVIDENGDLFKYRWVNVSSRPRKPFDFLARPFIVAKGGAISIPAISFWKN